MFGPPKPKEGKCNAELHIADDYGDNHATLQCQLDPGHAGPHREEFKRDEKPVVVTWERDERESAEEDGGDDEDL